MKKTVSIALCLGVSSILLAGCSGSSEPFEEKTYTPDTQVSGINLDVRDREIEVSLSEDEQVHIQYSENSEEYYDISVSDENVLSMTSASEKEWSDYIGGKPSAEDRKISLQIPDGLLDTLVIFTTNEDITLPAAAVTDSISISSNGGDITFGDLEAGNSLSLTVKNGDISGTVVGSYDDYAIQTEIKKGESNLPDQKNDGEKTLNVSCNNGDVDIEFASPDSEIVEADWSEYFNGLNGTAVVYSPSERQYTIYNQEFAETRRPPCSTFKIISSLIALENGIITPENSTRSWSGEIFWNENWNKDIDFSEAFRTSCVWYFRQVVDDIGKDMMQEELDELKYGNCDISDWEGTLNTNSDNRALTGFWIESSLMISPQEQVEVMERIFGRDSVYSEETQNELKKVMLVPERDSTDISIYGKTGQGADYDVTVDAWFTGFVESETGNIYFCVRLGETDGIEISSTLAKEIAIKIASEFENGKIK